MKKRYGILLNLFALIAFLNVAMADGLSTTPGQRLHQGGRILPVLGGTGINTSTSSGIPSVSAGTWSVSTALPSTTTATTQSAADNSTKVATTAYVDALGIAGYNAQTTTYTILSTDKGKMVDFTGSSNTTLTLTSCSTLGNKWSAFVANSGTSSAIVTLNSNGGTVDTISAGTGIKMYPGEIRRVDCDATNFITKVLHGFQYKVTSSGSWTVPPGYKEFRQRIWASGQAGASRTTTGNAGGGAGGAYADVTLDSSKFVAVGSTETLTVAGTAAGVSGNTAGTTANSSSVTVNGTTFTVGIQNTASGYGTAPGSAASASAGTNGFPQQIFGSSYGTGGGGETGGVGGDVTTGNVPEQYGALATQAASLNGGGGGGASSSTAGGVRTGGLSFYGGAGGAGGANTGGNGTNGTVPGGGGGAAVQGGTSGSGAAGQIIVEGII